MKVVFNPFTGKFDYVVTSSDIDNSEWDSAYTHIGESGASHTYIDQSVVNGASPTFDGTNFSGIDHNSTTNLTVGDVHTQYALLAGRSGGQTVYGSTVASENLVLHSTSHATKGKIYLGANSVYDEVNDRLGIGTSPTAKLHTTGTLRHEGIAEIYDDRLMVTSDNLGNINYRDLDNPISFSGGLFGQYSLNSPNFNNLLYNATTRFSVTQTGFDIWSPTTLFNNNYDNLNTRITTDDAVATININLVSQGGLLSTGLTYPQGNIIVNFYFQYSTTSVRARLKLGLPGSEVWGDWIDNINISSTNAAVGYVAKMPTSSTVFCSEIEIEITADYLNSSGTKDVWVSEIEYVLARGVSTVSKPYVIKESDNAMYGDLTFNDTSDIEQVTINAAGITGLTTLSWDGTAVFNESGADVDFRIESDISAHTFFIDGGLGYIGVNKSNPTVQFDVAEVSTNKTTVAVGRFNHDQYTTASGTYYGRAMYGDIRPHVTAGQTNSGYAMGMYFQALRSLGATDMGTLTNLYGEYIAYGQNSTHADAVTTFLYGLALCPYSTTGTIGTSYDIYAANYSNHTKVTNKYGLYILGSLKTNYLQGSLVMGSPTGGSKGAGTINAKAVYDDNVLLSDAIWDLHYDGKIKEEDNKNFKDLKIWTIDETEEFTKKNRHLPTIVGREEWKEKGNKSVGQLINQLWLTIEQQQIQILNLNKLINK